MQKEKKRIISQGPWKTEKKIFYRIFCQYQKVSETHKLIATLEQNLTAAASQSSLSLRTKRIARELASYILPFFAFLPPEWARNRSRLTALTYTRRGSENFLRFEKKRKNRFPVLPVFPASWINIVAEQIPCDAAADAAGGSLLNNSCERAPFRKIFFVFTFFFLPRESYDLRNKRVPGVSLPDLIRFQ